MINSINCEFAPNASKKHYSYHNYHNVLKVIAIAAAIFVITGATFASLTSGILSFPALTITFGIAASLVAIFSLSLIGKKIYSNHVQKEVISNLNEIKVNLRKSLELQKCDDQLKSDKEMEFRKKEAIKDSVQVNKEVAVCVDPLEGFQMVNSDLILDEWLINHPRGYFAHAIWDTNLEKIMDMGILKPAELILREGLDPEFERGAMYEERAIFENIKINDDDLMELKNSYLSNDELLEFNKLKETVDVVEGKKLLIEFKKYRREYFNLINDKDEDEIKNNKISIGFLNKMINLYDNRILKDYVSYKYLFNLSKGINISINRKYEFFSTGDYNESLLLWDGKNATSHDNLYKHTKFYKCAERIAEMYGCHISQVLVAFDQQGREEKIDLYLHRKFKKGVPNGTIVRARQCAFELGKLNSEIRMTNNMVLWHYGSVAVLRGLISEEDKRSLVQDSSEYRRETFMRGPWENSEGKFFSFDLKNDPNILILGPKNKLESYLNRGYRNLIFIEELSPDHQLLFNILKENQQ